MGLDTHIDRGTFLAKLMKLPTEELLLEHSQFFLQRTAALPTARLAFQGTQMRHNLLNECRDLVEIEVPRPAGHPGRGASRDRDRSALRFGSATAASPELTIVPPSPAKSWSMAGVR